MNPAYPGLAAATLYLVGAFLQIVSLARTTAASKNRSFAIGGAAVLLHGVTVWLVVNVPEGIDLSLFSVGSLMSFVLVVIVLGGSLWQPLDNLFSLAFPLAAIAIVLSLVFSGEPISSSVFGPGLLTHVLVSILAYSVLMMAACQSIALSVQEVGLKRHPPRRFVRVLPPLQTMETLLFELLWLGLILLTLSIGSGFAFLEDMFAQHVVHHTVLAIASWVIFAILLVGRYAFGWRGKTATRWTLAGFGLLVLGYFGSKFVLEIILQARDSGTA